MRRYIATHLHFILTLLVVYPILIAYGVSGVGFVVMMFCMVAVHMSGRYTEYVDNRFLTLEQKDADA